MVARLALLAEIVRLSLDTLRANVLRSALTILGVVIGVMSIVSMTAMIRGFGTHAPRTRSLAVERVWLVVKKP